MDNVIKKGSNVQIKKGLKAGYPAIVHRKRKDIVLVHVFSHPELISYGIDQLEEISVEKRDSLVKDLEAKGFEDVGFEKCIEGGCEL